MSIELTTISNSLNGPEKIDKVLTQVRLTCTSVSKERDVPGQTGTGRPVIPEVSFSLANVKIPQLYKQSS